MGECTGLRPYLIVRGDPVFMGVDKIALGRPGSCLGETLRVPPPGGRMNDSHPVSLYAHTATAAISHHTPQDTTAAIATSIVLLFRAPLGCPGYVQSCREERIFLLFIPPGSFVGYSHPG